MSDPREDQEPDVDVDPTDVDGLWRNVPRPTTEELLTPSSQFADPPRIPRAVKVIGLLIVVVLLLLSIWLGFSLGRPVTPAPAPTPTPTAEEVPCALEAPTTVGKFVRGDVKETPRKTDEDRDLLSATYTDGTDKFVLLLSCPETDMSSYLSNAGVENAEPVEGSEGISCGKSIDTAAPLRVCARIENEKATAVAGLSQQSKTSLITLLNELREESQ